MTFVYPAVFTPGADGNGVDVSFPDLEMCRAHGRDFEEAADNAREAARNWIELEMEEADSLPAASLPEDIPVREGSEVRSIMVRIKLLPDYD